MASDGISNTERELGVAGHGVVVPGVYGPQDGAGFVRVVRSVHHGVVTPAIASSAAANAAGVIQPSALCGW